MLAAFLARATRTPFVWGRFDCCLFPSDWVMALGGKDPAAAWRGRYTGEDDCAALLERDGGLEAVARSGAVAAGLRQVELPSAGDIGLVRALSCRPGLMKTVLVGAICTGPRWAILSPGGLSTLPAEPVLAWRV